MQICFLGLGSMGRGMCKNLLAKGYTLHIWNRSEEKTHEVITWGAKGFDSPAKAAKSADAVFCCLSSPEGQKDIISGPDGVFATMPKNTTFHDLGTWNLSCVQAFEAEATSHGITYAYVPMGKGPEAAAAGESPLFFGGSREAFDKSLPLLTHMGIGLYMGDVQAACAFKLITNLVALSNNALLTEALHLAKAMGIEESSFMESAPHTGAWSYQMQNSGNKIFAEAFLPMRGTLNNALKDMKFGVDMAEEAHIPCPLLTTVRNRYQEAAEAGYGEEDYIAIYRLLQTNIKS